MIVGTAALAALVAVLGVLALVVSRKVGREGPARLASRAGATPAATVPRRNAPEVESRMFQVAEATGRVEAQRGGKWVPVVTGDVLSEEDLVRTGSGRAVLRLGSATEVELRERVELRLDSISRAGASLALRRGKVVARVETGRSVAITAAETRTENEGSARSRFVVLMDERGRVAVATTEGAARFEAAGKAVRVGAGTATHAEPGQPPAAPEVIGEEVFLSVVWPTGDGQEDKAPVSGKVDPGSEVRVNGAAADVDRAGRFTAAIPVRDGSNAIEVEVEDLAGRTRQERRDVRRIPTRPPNLSAEPAKLWNR
jgi:hypothetical protein